jgi:hypothetical protein
MHKISLMSRLYITFSNQSILSTVVLLLKGSELSLTVFTPIVQSVYAINLWITSTQNGDIYFMAVNHFFIKFLRSLLILQFVHLKLFHDFKKVLFNIVFCLTNIDYHRK